MTNWIRSLLVCCCLAMSQSIHAQTYPTKPVRLIVPYPPGGSGDVVGRLIGAKLTEAWGQQILLDNRPGANGNIGAAAVARAPADGYTLLLGTDIQMSISPQVYKELPYDPVKDFVNVIGAVSIEYMLSVHPSIPASTLPELIAYLKARPGKHAYASTGIGSFHHLWTEWFKSIAGVDMLHVPYKGSGQIIPDLVAGRVQIAYMGVPQSLPFMRSGQIKAIATGARTRLSTAPELPTIDESIPDGPNNAYWAYFAPAATPNEVVRQLNQDINKVLAMPDVRAQFVKQGLFPIGGSSESLTTRIKSDYTKWGNVIRGINFKPE